jgi:hypothetical protein
MPIQIQFHYCTNSGTWASPAGSGGNRNSRSESGSVHVPAMVEGYIRARLEDLAAEFPELSACRVLIEKTVEQGWRIRMALVSAGVTIFVRDPVVPIRGAASDPADAVDRTLRVARRSLSAGEFGPDSQRIAAA